MRKASITLTSPGGDPINAILGPGDGVALDGLEITINRVRAAAATMSTSAGQDIALGVGESAALFGGAGSVTLNAVAEV